MKGYGVSKIVYNPNNDYPYGVVYLGEIAGQDGIEFGTGTHWFKTIEDACDFQAKTIEINKERYIEIMNEKEKQKSPLYKALNKDVE